MVKHCKLFLDYMKFEKDQTLDCKQCVFIYNNIIYIHLYDHTR